MFGKVVTLDKKEYIVSFDEYKQIPHNEYNNLNIIDKLGKHERLVSLINEISNIFKPDSNKSAVCLGLTHGGYIPINISEKYNNVHIYNNDKNKIKYIHNNIDNFSIYYRNVYNIIKINKELNNKQDNLVIYCKDTDDTSADEMDEIYNKINTLLKYDPIMVLPSIYYEKYIFNDVTCYNLSKSNYCVLVPYIFSKSFRKHFYYYIKDDLLKDETNVFNEILDYDNLIHLTMIVKNAGEKFEEVLTKNLPIIDRWTILDTGSTDNTIDIIKKVLVGKKKGELYQEPFIDFGASRNRCLELAGNDCKYKLMLDDTYVIEGGLRDFLEVTRGDQFADSFSLYITSDDVQYCSNRITKTTSNLKYIYKIHEVIQMENNVNVCVPIEKSRIFDVRADYMEKRTMDRKDYDLKLLFEMVEELPNDPRHLYYIGQTYNLLKKHELAFEFFMKRVEHPIEGNIQEKLDACFEAARLANFFLNRPWEECEKIYWRVFEMDKTRPEAMYFIGIHHYLENNKYEAYKFMKSAFEIGYPVHCQYSLKPTLSFHFVPKFLSELSYLYNDYETGEKCCKLFLENKVMGDDYYDIMKSWYDIFVILNKYNARNMLQPPKRPVKPFFCFLADGGFNKWSGSTILKQGVGGSETYIIELARYIQKSGKYNVVVFCNCENNEVFEGVEYKHILEYFDFVREISVEHCIISRYSEYLPFTLKSHVKNAYFVAHDLTPTGLVFPLEEKLKKVFCLSEWHVEHFISIIPQLKHITEPFYYGIDKELFDNHNTRKQPYKFIYSSFPHRGLLALLQMWPRIIKKYSSASLYIHCDIENEWVNENATDHMKLLKEVFYNMIKESRYNIYYMGWTSKEKLAQSWKSADVWLYPCIFRETFCLTALEAAISKTLVVTNDLAALKNTVADRGLVIPMEGQLISERWYNECLEKMFDVLDNREKHECYVNKNYEWAKNMTWENRANDLIKLLDKNSENDENNNITIKSKTNIKYNKYNKDDNNWNILKIGAHTGSDDNSFIPQDYMKIILVEPVKEFYDELKYTYSQKYPKYTIEYVNKAISNSNGYTTIYCPTNNNNIKWIKQCSSISKEHILNHGYNDKINECKVNKITLNKLVKMYNINKLDYLIVDTEGHDYKILMNYDFELLKPRYIQFEYAHMDGYNTWTKNYKKLCSYLEENGYKHIITGQMDCLYELITEEYNEYCLNKDKIKQVTENIKEDHGTQKYIDNTLKYMGMYNWTNDLPEGSRDIFIEQLNEFNKNNNKQNKQILEIGTYSGVSLIKIMENIPNSYGTVIDSWIDYKEFKNCKSTLTENIKQNNIESYFYQNIKNKNIQDRVKVFKGNSVDKLLELIKLQSLNQIEKFDIIYVDGSHRLLDCFVDLILSWQLLEKNGMMIIDDYLYNKDNILESPYEAVNQFLDKYKNKYTLLHKSYRVFLIKH
uniref:Methyltransferase FkbM domain-containing protein n=1 Tax=viral metagenome TaxID=1070528 RepID=A0A6C0I7Z9_9ZZZZ